MIRRIPALLMILLLGMFFLSACSQGDGVSGVLTSPDEVSARPGTSSGGHFPLAYYDVSIDLINETLDAVPLRSTEFHLNVLPFMEPPPLVNLGLDWNSLQINPAANTVDVDIIFKHPFPNSNEFMGFDVKGIVITDGSLGGFTDTGVVIPRADEPRLVNADGYSRWWNPREFTMGGLFGYNNGLLGAPDSYMHYGSTVNGYKYFSDGLYKNSSIASLNVLLRGRFSAGAKNTRHYQLSFGANHSDFLKFNYAVDASWAAPMQTPPTGMEDFPPEANQSEPFMVVITQEENTVYYSPGLGAGGGFADLRIDVKDWQTINSIASVRVEAPELFEGFVTADPDPSNDPANIYGTYYAHIEGAPANNDDIQVLVTVEDTNDGYGQGGMNLFSGPEGTLLAAYQVHTLHVSTNSPPYVGPVVGFTQPICGLCYHYTASVSDYEDNGEDLIWKWIVTPPGSPPEDYYIIGAPGCDDSDKTTLDISFNKNGMFTINLKVTDTAGGYSYSTDPLEVNAKYGGAPDPVGNVVLTVTREDTIAYIDKVVLDWEPVSGASGYAVYWTDDPYADPPMFDFLDTTYASDYTIDPLNPNNAYLFMVRARTVISNPSTESGDSEYAYVEFETADPEDPYPWTVGYRISATNDRWERVEGAGAMAGEWGWRIDVTDTYIEPYTWSVIASPEIPDFDNVEMCRLEFLRKHENPFDHHGVSVGTTDDIFSSAATEFENFDVSMHWIKGLNYNKQTIPAIQQRFLEASNNCGGYQDYCAYFAFSAFEIPQLLTDRRAAIGYGADNYRRTARVAMDDIAVIVY